MKVIEIRDEKSQHYVFIDKIEAVKPFGSIKGCLVITGNREYMSNATCEEILDEIGYIEGLY